MSEARIKIANLSNLHTIVGYRKIPHGAKTCHLSPKDIKEFDLKDIDEVQVSSLASKGIICYYLIPAIDESVTEVSRFELMEL